MRWLVAVLLVAGLAGCVDEAGPDRSESDPAPVLADPLTDGASAVESLTWAAQATIATGRPTQGPVPSGAYVVDMRGTMHIPDTERAPVALLMHGRHATCRIADMTETLGRICPDAEPVARPVANAHGYEYLGEHLASHGIFTISVNANNVNDFDNEFSTTGDDYGATARAQIIAHTLRELARADAGEAVDGWPDLSGKLDLSRVGLMGHSRGGEGAAAAASYFAQGNLDVGSADIVALFALAPTDFAHWSFEVPYFATILPYCDGDVSNLQGAWMFDENPGDWNKRQERYQFITYGANHNFYNTVWTNDDFGSRDDPWCDRDAPDGGRLDMAAQNEEGTMLIGAFFRYALTSDDGLGPMLRGEAAWPRDGVATSFTPPGSPDAAFDTRDWFRPASHHSTQGVFEGNVEVDQCATACQAQRSIGTQERLEITWDGPSRVALSTDVWFRPDWDRATLRLAIAPGSQDAALESTLTVGEHTRTLRELGVSLPPGDAWAKTILTAVDIPIPAQRTVMEWHLVGAGILQVGDGRGYSSK